MNADPPGMGGTDLSLWKKLLRGLARAGGALLALVLMALACTALILARPQDQETPAPQPLLSPSPAVSVSEETQLRDLVDSFPVPFMSFMSGSGMIFVSGVSSDTALEGGFGRILSLNWQTPEGHPVILQSIYPAAGLKLLKDDSFHFSRAAGPVLFGYPSVRMENGERIRLHVMTDSGVYVAMLPREQADRLSALTQSLQLFTTEPAP